MEQSDIEEIKIPEAESIASAENLEWKLRIAVTRVKEIESFSVGLFFQHLVSFLIFAVALMVDYKGTKK